MPIRTAEGNIFLIIGLKQQCTDEAVRALHRIMDPVSPAYGSYWTTSQVAQCFAPSSKSVDGVLSWLTTAGVSNRQLRRSHQGHEVSLHVPRSRLCRLFPSWTAPLSDQSATWMPVPSGLRDHVDFITAAPRPDATLRPQRRAAAYAQPSLRRGPEGNEVSCRQQTTPACLRSLYRIPFPSPDTAPHPNNSLGVHVPSWMTWRPEDLDAFFGKFVPNMVGQRPVMAAINGGYRNLDVQMDPFNLEANLDFEYAMALTYPLAVTNIQVGSQELPGPQIGTMLAAFDDYYCGSLDPSTDPIPPDKGTAGFECGTTKPPNVISISFAWPEHQFPAEYLSRQCLEFLKLSLQGVTVVVATGDAGVGGHPDGFCSDPFQPNTNTTTSGNFVPNWPASCPWVTAVGGTSPSDPYNPESLAYRRFFNNNTRSSSGGFSNIFPLPLYQASAVRSYLTAQTSHLSPLASRFNATGRAYPDISALASGYRMVTDGKWRSVHGTSAAAPVVASIKPVGFINPVLYAHPEMFNDVTDGANAGCGVEQAFGAADGWDAVTGLGSLDFERMRQVFLGLP
ncbi:peptidase S8/S53 domain-containing protein [Immersiella caudata]|uniref:tripeptidyl-peptidase II n=1 Tax=Immersiella caudata TaxID=314043 RepID=A0AA39WY87_9PEZI|nr:peptidase S8/S53 domain-containing protein [Immersiella caudata]